jgi:hypothetical protein
MGKGLSPLQRKILAILRRKTLRRKQSSGGWIGPGDILKALGYATTPYRRTSLSRSLRNLHRRRLVSRRRPTAALVGHAYRYKISRIALSGR